MAPALKSLRIALLSHTPQDYFASSVLCHLDTVPDLQCVEAPDADVLLFLDSAPDPSTAKPSQDLWFFRYDGLSECDRGIPCTAGSLERYTALPGRRVVLDECHLSTDVFSPAANHRAIRAALTFSPARVCRAILENRLTPRELPALPNPPQPSPLLPLKTLVRSTANQFHSLLFSEMWRVGVVSAPISRFLDPTFRPTVRWLPYDIPGQFLADPFAVVDDGRLRLLMEEYFYSVDRGRIVEASWADGALTSPIQSALDEPYHMSYPFPLVVDGMLHCTPECGQTNAAIAHRWTGEQWAPGKPILTNFPATDPTIFPHNGLWWMLATHRNDEVNAKLFLFSADHPLGPWTPHPANPVKTDVRSSRPAGTPFYVAGQLYRPAQDCSRSYGWRLTLNCITKLTPTEFEEKVITIVEPPPGPYRAGIHTLSAAGEFTLLDAKSFDLDLPMIPRRLKHKLSRIWETIKK